MFDAPGPLGAFRRSAFAGVHPRKQYFPLTIKAAEPGRGLRVRKAEQVSKDRWPLEVKPSGADEIDAEMPGWLREAQGLS